MSYFTEIYKKRLNRFGTDFQSRIKGQRADQFLHYVAHSVYKATFTYNSVSYDGVLEPYKNSSSDMINYLLTEDSLSISLGTLLDIVNGDGLTCKWLVWWYDQRQSEGYNRYIVIKIDFQIKWINNGYFTSYGKIYNTELSRVRWENQADSDSSYAENNNLAIIIAPYNSNFKENCYLEFTQNNRTYSFHITNVDNLSTNGISYISVDPAPKEDLSTDNTNPASASALEYWYNGGDN